MNAPNPEPTGGISAPCLTARLRKAMVYASCLHAGQTRKVPHRPTIGHLLGVASLVLQNGGDEDQAIAALLHDAIEDAGGSITLGAIEKKFGARVERIVESCTDSFRSPKPPWRERKEKYIAHLRDAPPEARLVSAADKLYNAREILFDYRALGESLWPRFHGGKEGTLWYYRELVKAFRAAGGNPLVDELDRVVTELENLAGVMAKAAERAP
jgi:(p)ppGpp synthase/HD superfamily hydrolase